MIGVFDSGVGGLASFSVLSSLAPRADIVYLADRRNAPYGTKTEEEIRSFVKNNIRRLRELGAERVLIACCTASTVCPCLEHDEKHIAFPIISPAARAAAKFSRTFVLATDRTVRSGAFSAEIERLGGRATELASGELVSLVEGGERDGRLSKQGSELIDEISDKVRCSGSEALILGCTHFSHIGGELARRLPGVRLISPAVMGAKEFYRKYEKECPGAFSGSGKRIYTE